MIWTASDFISAVNGVAVGNHDQNAMISGLAIDSRQVKSGDAFIAITGEHHDGHDFIPSAMTKGASAILMSANTDLAELRLSDQVLYVQVDDPMKGLERLAVAARNRHQGTRIAITGSVGKTGTRMLVAQALAAYGKTHFSEGNLNNHIGAPLSLARMPKDAAFGVFEAGMNHAGELTALSQFIAPHIGIITQIADSHSGNFPNLEAIALAKAEIFDGLVNQEQRLAILNADDPFAPLLEQKARDAGAERVIRFGYSDIAEHQILSVRRQQDGLAIEANIRGEAHHFKLGMMAPHWAKAAIIALSVVDALGLPLEPAKAELAKARDLPGRGARSVIRLKKGPSEIKITVIDDSYNAGPASMVSALSSLSSDPQKGRRVAILGDMLELDRAADKHAALAETVEASGISHLITVGEMMQHLNSAISVPSLRCDHAANAKSAFPLVLSALEDGDLVLIKGSNGMRLSELVHNLSSAIPHTNGDSHAA